MKIESLTVGPLAENCYLVIDESTNRAVLIDPGDEPERILSALSTSGATLDAIWLTHAHFDHVGAIAGVVREHPVPVHMHPLDAPVLEQAVDSALRYGVRIDAPPAADLELAEGDVLSVGSVKLEVIHLPGHAPGHVAFHGNGVIFGGDCLFAGSIGRSDIPYGDRETLDASLVRMVALGDDLAVYPGHGPRTTIGRERRSNPFLLGAARHVRLRR
ncbi:MAG TPA: MBL fold metallo-hydrolase [Gemmatimonadaceae bacterium]|jgi:glyoxylase-like metal-dependent hydrolase (beta-lactamase superfamily II)